MRYNLGQTVELVFTVTPDETPTLTVTAPDGTVSTPVVTGSAGSYAALVDANQPGTWTYIWSTPNGGDEHGSFQVGVSAVSLSEVKAHLNITTTANDDELSGLVDAAVEVIAEYVGTPLMPTVVTETLSRSSTIILSSSNVRSLTSVTSDGVAVTGYTLAPGGLLTSTGYGYGGTVVVTYFAGFDRLPAAVRQAVLIVVGRLWETQRGNAPSALPSSDFEGSGFSTGGLPLLPPLAVTLLQPYRRGQRVA